MDDTNAERIVVTGPGGWIGAAFIAHLAAHGGAGWADRLALFGASEREIRFRGRNLPVRLLSALTPEDTRGALVVHLAYLTREKVAAAGEARFFADNQAIDAAVLRCVAAGRPRGLFVASSGAAALAARGEDRHLYGWCKLMQEDRFLAFGREAGVPVFAGRIYNLAGPSINKVESYAIASFIVQALRTGRIEIAARRPVYRSYIHVDDLCRVVLRALASGEVPDGAVDLAGAECLEMGDIGRAVADGCGVPAEAVHRAPIEDWRPAVYLGDPTPLRTMAMRQGIALRPFAVQLADTIADLRLRVEQD